MLEPVEQVFRFGFKALTLQLEFHKFSEHRTIGKHEDSKEIERRSKWGGRGEGRREGRRDWCSLMVLARFVSMPLSYALPRKEKLPVPGVHDGKTPRQPRASRHFGRGAGLSPSWLAGFISKGLKEQIWGGSERRGKGIPALV